MGCFARSVFRQDGDTEGVVFIQTHGPVEAVAVPADVHQAGVENSERLREVDVEQGDES